jgi:hypothetical protein
VQLEYSSNFSRTKIPNDCEWIDAEEAIELNLGIEAILNSVWEIIRGQQLDRHSTLSLS